MPPAKTGVPSASPSSAAAWGRRRPTWSVEPHSSGRWPISTPVIRHSSSLQQPRFTSYRKVAPATSRLAFITPVARQLRYSLASSHFQVFRKISGSLSRTHRYFHTGSLEPKDPAPVIRRNFRTLKMFSPSTFSPVFMQRLNWRSARVSIQLMQGRRGRPCRSTITTFCIWEQKEIPLISSFGTLVRSSSRRVVRPMAVHHSSGSCSMAPPPSICRE